MPNPAFRSLIALNTPTTDERTPSMNPSTLLVDDHIRELRQVASDLQNEKTFGPARDAGPNRFRLAVGEALVQLGTAVAAGNRRASTQAN
jgi:hypothetical protein